MPYTRQYYAATVFLTCAVILGAGINYFDFE
jgi:hypothetical protein